MMNDRMDCFLDKDNIISNVPALDKSSLVLRNDDRENLFNPISNEFGNDFIAHVTK